MLGAADEDVAIEELMSADIDWLGEYNENETTYRQWCRACGGGLMGRHPQWGLVDVFAATIASLSM